MSKLYALRGLPGAGKSTLAKEMVKENPNLARVNRDDLRTQMFNKKGVLDHPSERAVTIAHDSMVMSLLKAGRDVVVDNLHLRPKYVRDLRKVAQKVGAEFELIDVHVDVEEAVSRQTGRPPEDRVPVEVIREMASKFYRNGVFLDASDKDAPPTPVEKYIPDTSRPKALICDLDGTLANMGERNPYDFTRVSEDTVVEHVLDIVRLFRGEGYDILFFSGRDDSCFDDTLDWITRHLPHMRFSLHMRKTGDGRPDNIIKQEMFDDVARNRFNVRFVIDDRKQVIRMWESLDIPVLNVGKLDEDF